LLPISRKGVPFLSGGRMGGKKENLFNLTRVYDCVEHNEGREDLSNRRRVEAGKETPLL